ncbi:YtxH domain-containing protein [Desulfurispira natronophila]|uniref:YtxH domain-containing protein n=1 Tax=Desulfurispira natronophila TaxID=682562 RepID=A0A7W7Y3R1_9BACT|nr:YtxH domain-containing protein [Desulfurispira natronophila]MBB5021520.1 hypothetical protein [Desulfurispira natronophila]
MSDSHDRQQDPYGPWGAGHFTHHHHNPYLQGGAPHVATEGFVGQARSAFLGGSGSDRFVKGMLIGAAATFLLTNEKAQQAIIKAGVNLFSQVASNVEELKEKVEDARAEAQEQRMAQED